MRKEIIIIATGVILVALISFSTFEYFSINAELKRVKKENEAFFSKADFERTIAIKADSIIIYSYKAKADSAISVIKAIEEKKKANKIYFKNKLNEIKNVNTFFKRSAYCDSIEQWLQSGEISL
ncbi:MAG: hypothetical protein V4549_17960 [Bacteroidota bacterium]